MGWRLYSYGWILNVGLPIFITQNKDIQLLQNVWSSQINPILNIPLLHGVQLKDINLTTGNNTINHLLGRQYQGYLVTSMRNAYANLYAVPNNLPNLNLVLNSSGSTQVDIWVF